MAGHLYGVPMVSGLASSDPEQWHSFVFLHSAGSRQRRTAFSSLMVDTKNMSIQASLKRFKSSENLPIHLTISMFPLIALVN